MGGAGAPPFEGIPAEAVCLPGGIREESGAEGCILSVDTFVILQNLETLEITNPQWLHGGINRPSDLLRKHHANERG